MKKKKAGALSAGALFLSYFLLTFVGSYMLPKRVKRRIQRAVHPHLFYGDPHCEGPDRIELIERPEQAFDERIRIIEAATERLDISCHCIQWGVCAKYIFSCLFAAADRGVKIRLILDGKLHGLNGPAKPVLCELARHPNIEFKLYNPLNLLTPWRWNSLLHDKFIIADDRLLILGGRNIGDQYFNSFGYDGAVCNDRDVLVYNRFHGTEVSDRSVLTQVRQYMDMLWTYKHTRPIRRHVSPKARRQGLAMRQNLKTEYQSLRKMRPELFGLTSRDFSAMTVPTFKITLIHNPINTSKKEPWVGYQLRSLAMTARSSITLQSPYVVAGKPMRKAFRRMVARTGDVTLLTNSIASSPNFPAFSYYLNTRKRLLKTGMTIYELQSRDSIHGKSYLMDGRFSAVGSLNLDDRSLYIDTETMLVIDSPAFNRQLTHAVNAYKSKSRIVSKKNRYLPNDDVVEVPVSGLKKWLMHTVSYVTRLIRFLV